MRVERTRKDMESLAEGIREEVDNLARVEALPDRLHALDRIAQLSKHLRTLCNREAMEVQRMNLDRSKPTTTPK